MVNNDAEEAGPSLYWMAIWVLFRFISLNKGGWNTRSLGQPGIDNNSYAHIPAFFGKGDVISVLTDSISLHKLYILIKSCNR